MRLAYRTVAHTVYPPITVVALQGLLSRLSNLVTHSADVGMRHCIAQLHNFVNDTRNKKITSTDNEQSQVLNSKRHVERVEKGKQNDWMWRENLLYTPNSYTQLNGSHRQSSHHRSLALNGPIEFLLLSGTRVNRDKGIRDESTAIQKHLEQ